MNEEHDKDCCSLCGGTGEVQITPYGQADSHADVFGCPACIQADRDEAERERDQLQARVNELESQQFSWRVAYLDERKKANKLLVALEAAKAPLEMYRAYGWTDRNGVIGKLDAAIAAVKGK